MKVDKKSTQNFSSRGGEKPKFIVLHIQDGYYNSGILWMQNTAAQVSSHFLVSKEGDVAQLVDIENAAWTQGLSTIAHKYSSIDYVKMYPNINPNKYCISIEFEGFYNDFYSNGYLKAYGTHGKLTDKQLNTAAELINYINDEVERIYGYRISVDRSHIIGHYQINPRNRACCGLNFDYDYIISKSKNLTMPPAEVIYRVQTGAFYVKRNADAMLDKIKAMGFNGYVKRVGLMYKIQIGAFSVVENAKKLNEELLKLGIPSIIITEKR